MASSTEQIINGIKIHKVPTYDLWKQLYNESNGINVNDLVIIPPEQIQSALPTQSGQSGKFLTTDGVVLSWETINALPSQSGQNGKFLTTNGTSASWATVDVLPSQSGQNGKFLTTNGTSASWGSIPADSSKQDLITTSGILKGSGSGNITAAVAGTDYAPAYREYASLSSNTTLSSSNYGKYLMCNGTITVTLPTASSSLLGVDFILHNIGTDIVTISGALRVGGTEYSSTTLSLKMDEAALVKCIKSSGNGAWVIIGLVRFNQYFSGTTTPNNQDGVDGDLYLQTEA